MLSHSLTVSTSLASSHLQLFLLTNTLTLGNHTSIFDRLSRSTENLAQCFLCKSERHTLDFRLEAGMMLR